jgi:hypothetical protein
MTRQSLVVGAALLMLSGCTATVKPTGYLDNYQQMKSGNELEQFWSDPAAIAKAQPAGVVLGSIDVRATAPTQAARDQAQSWLSASLLGSTASPTDRDICGPTGPNAARLDVAITEMDPGSGFARVMAGELGAGHAWVQVEGRVTGADGALLATFADRQRDSGYHGLQDTLGDVGPALVKERLTAIGAATRDELAQTFHCKPQ